MPDPYPFRGVWRWAVLPALLAAAGALDGLVEILRSGQSFGETWQMPVFDGLKGVVEGAAMASGRRPAVGGGLAFLLGAMSGWTRYALDAPFTPLHLAISGLGPAIFVLAHHAYLRLRRRGRAGWLWGAPLYLAASASGYAIFNVSTSPNTGISDLMAWAVEESALSWMAMALALRGAERAAPAPTPPAPEA